MSDARVSGVVANTMVISWLFADEPHLLVHRYRSRIG
jgi:hypothetical protein